MIALLGWPLFLGGVSINVAATAVAAYRHDEDFGLFWNMIGTGLCLLGALFIFTGMAFGGGWA